MWIVLAVISFLVGQLYLFRCLGKLDQFLDTKNEEKKILSVALAEPIMEEQMSNLLEGYSIRHPDVDLVIYVDTGVIEAVRQRKADVGFCRLSDGCGSLNCLMLSFPGGSQKQVVWNNNDKVGEFVQYFWQACGKW